MASRFCLFFKRICLSDTDTCRVPNGLQHHSKHSSQEDSRTWQATRGGAELTAVCGNLGALDCGSAGLQARTKLSAVSKRCYNNAGPDRR